jgi:hypothetical protein
MCNACGRLLGNIESGVLYTYIGNYVNDKACTNTTAGIAACFFAGTLSSLIAVLTTIKIDDNEGGLKCGPCTLVGAKPDINLGIKTLILI